MSYPHAVALGWGCWRRRVARGKLGWSGRSCSAPSRAWTAGERRLAPHERKSNRPHPVDGVDGTHATDGARALASVTSVPVHGGPQPKGPTWHPCPGPLQPAAGLLSDGGWGRGVRSGLFARTREGAAAPTQRDPPRPPAGGAQPPTTRLTTR